MDAVLFKDVMVFDGSGSARYSGDVLVRGARIAEVFRDGAPAVDCLAIEGRGATLMPGMVEAHAHLSFGDFADGKQLGQLPPEDHALVTACNARLYLERGFTSCVSGASAKRRLDVAVRDAINAGRLPGPRLLAASPELTVTAGLGDVRLEHLYRESYALCADGADQFRALARACVRDGVDTLKINVSGDDNVPHARAAATVMTDAEAAAVCEVGHAHGVRIAAHARSRESIRMALRHGVTMIYHCSFCDEGTLDALEAARDHIFVGPTIGALDATLRAGERFGLGRSKSADAATSLELDAACESARALHARGVRIVPGGDYGFAWNPHGENARDLALFVDRLGLSAIDTLVAATRLGGEAMGRGGELGQIRAGWLADLLLVDGDPTDDITVLQDPGRLRAVMKDGKLYRS